MSCDQLKEFEALTKEVLLYVDETHQQRVIEMFNNFKVKHFHIPSTEPGPLMDVHESNEKGDTSQLPSSETGSLMDVDESNEEGDTSQISEESELFETEETSAPEETRENKMYKRRTKFYEALMQSLRSDSLVIPSTTTIEASYTSFKDLLEAISNIKKQLDRNCVSVVQKSVEVGRLFWISKTFGMFKEAYQFIGYSRVWANFLVNLHNVYRRHPNIYKSTLPLHVLRSNMDLLNDIGECLPEFDQFT